MDEVKRDVPEAGEARRYIRRWSRQSVQLSGRLEVVVGRKVVDRGTAVVRDVSLRGALLTRLKLRKNSLPVKPFRLRLELRSGRHAEMGAVCVPVRFGRGKAFELAVEFEDFWIRYDKGRPRS